MTRPKSYVAVGLLLLFSVSGTSTAAPMCLPWSPPPHSEQSLADVEVSELTLIGTDLLSSETPDYDEARRYLFQAAEGGDAVAINALGVIYEHGSGVPRDIDRAIEYYERAAAQGDTLGMRNLANGLLIRDGDDGDLDLVEQLLRDAASSGLNHAQFDLAIFLQRHQSRGRGGESIEWLQSAADGEYVPAYARLGESFRFGIDVAPDDSVAVEWFIRSAEAGDPIGLSNLASYYENGIILESGATEAFRLFQLAAQACHTYSQHKLALMYQRGIGTEQSDDAAFRWALEAAERGLAPAQNTVGLMYLRGQGVDQDDEVGNAWLLQAANQNLPTAQFNLAISYLNGWGVDADLDVAVGWLCRASEAGHARATSRLRQLERSEQCSSQ